MVTITLKWVTRVQLIFIFFLSFSIKKKVEIFLNMWEVISINNDYLNIMYINYVLTFYEIYKVYTTFN